MYEQIFTLRPGDRLVQDHFITLRGLLDELDIYDITKIRQYCKELAVATYLLNLNPDLSFQIRRYVLGAEAISDLQSTFSRVLRISTVTLPSVADHSTMAAPASRGRARGDTRGHPRCQHCGR